jgi:hypothetical protein
VTLVFAFAFFVVPVVAVPLQAIDKYSLEGRTSTGDASASIGKHGNRGCGK